MSLFGRLARGLYAHSVLALSLLLLLGVSLTLLHFARLSQQLVETSALQGTTLQADSLEELRTLYTSEVVERVRAHGIEAGHDYREVPGRIPLPATFTIELGRRVGERGSGMLIRLYSDHPFPFRTDGGPRDAFERDALTYLRAHPDEAFWRFEDTGRHAVLRYARADVMRTSCVNCHNSRPDSPKRDWKVGDVRGVLEITRPLDTVVASTRSGLRETAVLIGFMSLLGLAGVGLVVARLRRTSEELEQRVAERTGALAAANEGLRREIGHRQRVEQELEVARDQAVSSAKLKSQFLANMSHEIRTPMNGIVGMADLLGQTTLTAQQREFLERLESCSETLLGVINDVLDFSKIEAGKLHVESIDFDLRATVEAALEPLAEKAQQKGLEIASIVHADVAAGLRGDPLRLRQVLTNLAGNAVKFTSAGEVIVRAECAEDSATHQLVRFAVSDTGIGIPEDVLPQLFQAFSQADGSTTRRFGGTGLGLAICKELVELMGGEIRVTSTPAQGSTFTFTVRLAKSDRPVSGDGLAADPRLEGRRVLIVDDNETNRTILRYHVEGWRMAAQEAANGRDALLAVVHAAIEGRPWDLVILDMQMPELDGLRVARAIRGDTTTADTRIVLLTSLAHLDPREVQDAGVDLWLTKPVKRASLLVPRAFLPVPVNWVYHT